MTRALMLIDVQRKHAGATGTGSRGRFNPRSPRRLAATDTGRFTDMVVFR